MGKRFTAIAPAIFNTSVTAASNFFATHFSTVSENVEWVWIQYASATNSILEVVIDDGSASVVTSIQVEGIASTIAATAALATYKVLTYPRYSYNFSPSVSGTTIFFCAYKTW